MIGMKMEKNGYLDSLEKFEVIVKIFKDPSEDSSGGVLGGEENSDDIIGDLIFT